MRRCRPIALLTSVLSLCWAAGSQAQTFSPDAAHNAVETSELPSTYTTPALHTSGPCGCHQCQCSPCNCGTYTTSDPQDVFVAGADYLLIRPHFSEAVAFAQGRQTASSLSTRARELDFDYDSNFRAFIGLRSGCDGDEVRFTYSRITGETEVNGAVTQPGDFIVDPFGNLAGAVVVVDPSSGLFGTPLVGGDRIETRAEVELNVFDLEFIRPFNLNSPSWWMSWSAGLRVADIEQFYESSVTAGGLPLAYGDFSAEFIGAGPRLGLEGRRYFANGNFGVFARGYGSLLVGDYDVANSNTVNLPTTFVGSQSSSMTRLIPVAEAEFGGMWQPSDMLKISAGWLFQSWFDLGTSGGTFGGFFAGADDGNTMSFDGLFIRAEVGF
jgi:hypothetical protein